MNDCIWKKTVQQVELDWIFVYIRWIDLLNELRGKTIKLECIDQRHFNNWGEPIKLGEANRIKKKHISQRIKIETATICQLFCVQINNIQRISRKVYVHTRVQSRENNLEYNVFVLGKYNWIHTHTLFCKAN